MRWFCLSILAVLAGCSRANPAFDGANAVPMAGTDGEDSGDGDGPPAMVTTDSASGSMTGPQTTTDDPTDTGSGSTTAQPTTGDDSTGADAVCPPHWEDRFLQITLGTIDGDVPVKCPDGYRHLSGIVSAIGAKGSGIQIYHCPKNACTCGEPEVYTLEVEAEIFPAYDSDVCADVFVGPNDGAALAGCAWESFAVVPRNEVDPAAFGANALDIPTPWRTYAVQLDEDQRCGSESCGDGVDHPGTYNLSVSGDSVDDTEPVDVVLEGLDVSLTNRMAHVTADCETHVSWTAVQKPPG